MKKITYAFILGVVVIVVSYGILLLYLTWPVSSLTIDKAGVFGDSFGLLTSLFSGLAFAGIIITILLQREELQFQRQELKLQREEISRSATAQEASGKWFAYQARMMSLSALTSLLEIKMRNGEGCDRVLVDALYKELVQLLDGQKN